MQLFGSIQQRIAGAGARLRRAAVRLARDTGGGVMMEYAFVGPPFIALLLANFHTALVFLAQEGLQTAAESAARLVTTGQAQTYAGTTSQGASYNGMTAADFRKAVCGQLTGIPKMLPPFLTCDTSRLFIDVSAQSAGSVNSISNSALGAPTFSYDSSGNVTNTFNTSFGTTGQIVVLKLIYLWPTAKGPFGFNMTNQQGSNRQIIATAVFKNESYDCASGQSTC